MSPSNSSGMPRGRKPNDGITGITVGGYKSIVDEQSIEVRNLTILAGANSSGKSSIMQPLLLLKQTLEASYDPGALLLDGPNVRFSSVDQFFTVPPTDPGQKCFSVGMKMGQNTEIKVCFERVAGKVKGLRIREMTFQEPSKKGTLHESMTHDEILALVPAELQRIGLPSKEVPVQWAVSRERCFLVPRLTLKGERVLFPFPFPLCGTSAVSAAERALRGLIHLPGLRGNPRRSYAKTAVGSTFQGVFQEYTASVISRWQDEDKQRQRLLGRDLQQLGLTWKVAAKPIEDTEVELNVGRLPRALAGGGWDLVNIADVGFGVSQALPVLVALHVAEPGQTVYLEQPEIHLHPKAQVALAQVLASAAQRGVRVVAETHSALLILGIQALVARGILPPGKVKMHWFSRGEDGHTQVRSADLDESGAFGDWPEDFAETEMKAQSAFLDAAEARHPLPNDAK
ncbi:MAG: AAA family ATPase [Planctomycetota bacterium]|nr:AAA family ATPase [Planctomycetota bacterium]